MSLVDISNYSNLDTDTQFGVYVPGFGSPASMNLFDSVYGRNKKGVWVEAVQFFAETTKLIDPWFVLGLFTHACAQGCIAEFCTTPTPTCFQEGVVNTITWKLTEPILLFPEQSWRFDLSSIAPGIPSYNVNTYIVKETKQPAITIQARFVDDLPITTDSIISPPLNTSLLKREIPNGLALPPPIQLSASPFLLYKLSVWLDLPLDTLTAFVVEVMVNDQVIQVTPVRSSGYQRHDIQLNPALTLTQNDQITVKATNIVTPPYPIIGGYTKASELAFSVHAVELDAFPFYWQVTNDNGKIHTMDTTLALGYVPDLRRQIPPHLQQHPIIIQGVSVVSNIDENTEILIAYTNDTDGKHYNMETSFATVDTPLEVKWRYISLSDKKVIANPSNLKITIINANRVGVTGNGANPKNSLMYKVDFNICQLDEDAIEPVYPS